MTAYSSTCGECGQMLDWWECPTGGWWSHRVQPVDFHPAVTSWQPMEKRDEVTGEWVTI